MARHAVSGNDVTMSYKISAKFASKYM